MRKVLPILFFILGTLAMLAAGYFLYTRITGKSPENPANIVRDMLAGEADELPNVGYWVLEDEDGAPYGVSMAMVDGRYEIVYVPDETKPEVLYTRGTYEYDRKSGMLILQPRRDMGSPAVKDGVSLSFLNLNKHDIPARYQRHRRQMVWTGGQSQGHVSLEHPLFVRLNPKNRKLIWRLSDGLGGAR